MGEKAPAVETCSQEVPSTMPGQQLGGGKGGVASQGSMRFSSLVAIAGAAFSSFAVETSATFSAGSGMNSIFARRAGSPSISKEPQVSETRFQTML